MFTEMEEKENQGYEVMDGCYGTVVGRCQKGAFVTLDNGEDAFAYKFANLWPGTKVLCTVLRLADEGCLGGKIMHFFFFSLVCKFFNITMLLLNFKLIFNYINNIDTLCW